MRIRIFLAVVGALLAAPAAAHASSVHYEGDTLVFSGSGGDNYVLIYSAGDGSANVDVTDNEALSGPADRCEQLGDRLLRCAVPSAVRVALGDGKDFWSPERGLPFGAQVDGGTGDDELKGTDRGDVLTGGAGTDKLEAYGGEDRIDGGDGDDTVNGGTGRDNVLGGAGNDHVSGDGFESPFADVVDGGPGVDTMDADWLSREYDAVVQPVTLTLAGGADDGRAGEGDDVRGVERFHINVPGTFTGTDAAEELVVRQTEAPVTMRGNGGDDVLKTGDGVDALDGGAGNDALDGGFNDDTIVGGPGRDRVSGDVSGGDCGPAWCKYPYGNDTIDVRDGEVDSVLCGPGSDTVEADPGDTIANDCETVRRAAGGGPDAQSGGRVSLRANGLKLRDARGKGLMVSVTVPTAGALQIVARRGKTVVGRGAWTVDGAGSSRVRLKKTKAARRLRRNMKITLTATFRPNGGAAQTARASGRLR